MPDWELSKENYMPLKRGRDASALQAIENETEADKNEQILLYEQKLRTEEDSEDPLAVYIGYVRWAEEHFPSGNVVQLRKVLEKCLMKFKKDPRYTQDPRFLFIWIKFAHSSSAVGSMGIYEHMQAEGMCTKLAQFYMQWAHELEAQADFKKAGEIFRAGIDEGAAPKEKLEEAYNEFQERVARSMMDEAASRPDSPEDTRMFLGMLKGVGKHKKTPVMRDTHQLPGALASASKEKDGNKATFFAFDENDLLKRPQKIKKLRPSTSSTKSSGALPTDPTLHKENFKAPAPWTGQKLGGADKIKRHSSASSVPADCSAAPAFPVFQDHSAQNRRQTISGDGHALKSQKTAMYHPLAKLEEKKDDKLVYCFCVDRVGAGETEFSFEELRHMHFVPKHPPKQMSKQTPITPIPESRFEYGTPRADISNNAANYDRNMQSFNKSETVPVAFNSSKQGIDGFGSAVKADVSRTSVKSDVPNVSANESAAAAVHFNEIGRRSAFAPVPSIRPSVGSSTPSSCSLVTRTPSSCADSSNLSSASSKKQQPSFAAVPSPQVQNPNRFMAHASAPSPNGSMTQNCFRQAMAVFSDTIQLPNVRDQSQEDQVSQEEEKPPASFEVYSEPSQAFVVFDDNVQKVEEKAFEVFVDDGGKDKENEAPKGTDPPVKTQRKIDGVLSPSSAFKTNQEEFQEERMDSESPFFVPLLPGIALPNQQTNPLNFDDAPTFTGQFDFNEPTLARFGSVAASERVMSTPFDPSRIARPSFSTAKPWQSFPEAQMDCAPSVAPPSMHVDTSAKAVQGAAASAVTPVASEDNAMDTDNVVSVESTTHKTPHLSVIQESSREFRSGSSCLSSGSSSVDSAESGRKRLISAGASTEPNLKPIAEQSYNSGAEQVQTYECTFPAQRMQGPPKSEGKTDRVLFEEAAAYGDVQSTVRRLSLGGAKMEQAVKDDLDESIERTGTGLKFSITSAIDPWDAQLISKLLVNKVTHLDAYPNFHMFLSENMPSIRMNKAVELGGDEMMVNKLLGEGAFARAYLVNTDDSKDWVLKAQKPGWPWEFYICEEMNKRLQASPFADYVVHSIMATRDFYLFLDGSILVNEYHNNGTLLDLVNYANSAGKRGIGEALSMFFLIQMMKIIEYTHKIGIVHADVKPDNILLTHLPQVNQSADDLITPRVECIKLIDWGRAIDMRLFPEGTTFKGTAQTSAFQCPEMLSDREWTYQTDLFGLIACAHVFLFGTYMKIYEMKATNTWKMNSTFMRRWNTSLWRDLFHKLLNIESCDTLPNVAECRAELETALRMQIQEEHDNWIEDVNFINHALAANRRA